MPHGDDGVGREFSSLGPDRTRRWLTEDPFFAELFEGRARGKVRRSDEAKFLERLVRDAVFEVLWKRRGEAVEALADDPFAGVRAALSHWVEEAWLEAVREGAWLFCGPHSDGVLLHGVEGVFLLWPDAPAKILTEGIAAVPGAPASREGMPQDLNDWLRVLSQSGVIETRGDAGALFLIRVPALPDRRKGGLTDKVSGRLSEAVLLRDGERYLEAARMRAAEVSELFFEEPLGRLLAEDLAEAERAVSRSTAGWNLKQCQFDALVSLAFNIGVNAFQNSTLLKLVKQSASEYAIRNEFGRWCHSGGKVLQGLQRRRAAEADMYFGNVK